MVTITRDHLEHMAKRNHATMKKLDAVQEKFSLLKGRWTGTLETAGGAWLGGTIEGRTGGGAIGPIPFNLGLGLVLIGAGHFGNRSPGRLGAWSEDLNSVGNGVLASWAAATGFAFGKRWKESGHVLGGGGHPWSHPYAAAP
jgi:hypothetical protein